jgi:exportin-5
MTGNPEFTTENILEALQIIHDSQTPNDVRNRASSYLEQFKYSKDANLRTGVFFATHASASPLIHHFGLSLLAHAVRTEIPNLSEEEATNLRHAILDLGRSVKAEQPAFVRNKIAELWIELAKRTWALDWFELDELLVQLWAQDLVHKEFVLTILENLSEDTFVREDSTAILRGRDLHSAMVEIFTPSLNYLGGIKIGGKIHSMRSGEEGWLTRIADFINDSLAEPSLTGQLQGVVLKALATLRSAFVWAMTPAISQSRAFQAACNFLMSTESDLLIAALDVLLSLYGRVRLEELEVQALVLPSIHPDSIATFSKLYLWSVVSADDLDSPKYVVSKKLSELLSLFGDHISDHAALATSSCDVGPFLQLLTTVAEHESLIVSIPVIHAWVKLLETPSWREKTLLWECIGQLVPVVSERLIQYDQFPDTVRNPIVLFMNEEIELFPERQGFYQNYRRLCAAVIEYICLAIPEKAMVSILGRIDAHMDEIESAELQFGTAKYERLSMQALAADAVFSLVDAAYKGFDRFRDAHRMNPTPEQEQLRQRIRGNVKGWMLNMINRRNFKDPQIRQRQIKTAVDASYRMLQKDTGYAFSVLEHILSSFITTPQEDALYAEAVEDLHSYATAELRRLSLQHADYFVTFYDQLQSKFSDLVEQVGANARLQVDLKSILFSVIQRATSVDSDQRKHKLEDFLQPIAAAWADEGLQQTLGSLESFARSQAFDQIGPYMMSLQAGRIEDWSQVPYDNTGVRIQQAMLSGYGKLPLRETRILLSISTERLEEGSDMHKMICDLWAPMVPTMLEYVLRLTSYNHQLHNPSSWPNATPESEGVIRRVLRDRYWQSGISAGSMGEFHTKVKATKSTLEGFASSVRGRVRNNLEQCYSILHTLGRLGAAFYNFERLPEMIAQAAIDTAAPLSPHHFSVMIQMLPKLIDECPPESRQHFLTPIIGSLLVQMDTKLSEEWEKMSQIKQTKHDDENLSDEMRDDSVLRQTTYKAVNMVAHWLNPKRELQLSTKKSIVNGNYLIDATQQTLREFVLSNVQFLEKLMTFVTHAITFKDTKSSYTMLSAVQRLVVDFASDHLLTGDHSVAIREFISTTLLMAAITCLHDGYYADHQQYFAQLIATIWLSYGLPSHVPATEETPAHERPALTTKPREVILSLPGMTEARVDEAAAQLLKEGGGGTRSKKLRAIILSLLEGVRGVRVSELGKIDTRPLQNKMLEKYRLRESLVQGGEENVQGQNDSEPQTELWGVADMFAT